ncbi:MAG: hypothetical protein GDA56_32125 [Hormoscilla sp. GM7CHS1pb]|nr:hypothetical protein [Hormoscilla sp. GM7CHS1pb]
MALYQDRFLRSPMGVGRAEIATDEGLRFKFNESLYGEKKLGLVVSSKQQAVSG